MNAILQQKILDLPTGPGVYIMSDSEGTIIYIGKAKILKRRVSQYFSDVKLHPPKVAAMVGNVADFRYILVKSEFDALSLEATLIKKHRPFYNILLKDDKRRPLIRIDLKKDFPTLEVVRRIRRDGAKYFGPYFGGVSVSDIIDLCRGAFAVRSCKLDLESRVKRTCLNYHLGLCSGPCAGLVSKEDYRAQITRIIRFLSGDDDEIATVLKARMKAASAAEEYEKALFLRDRIKMLESLGTRLVTDLSRDTDCDVFGFAAGLSHAAVTVMNIRGGKTVASENFSVTCLELGVGDAIAEFILQYYDGQRLLPREVLLPALSDDADALRDFLKEKYDHSLTLSVPERGVKRQLLETAAMNAKDFAEKSVDRTHRQEELTMGAMEELRRVLTLPRLPRRIECFDISHLSGTDMVASMAVTVDGIADKKSYRRFKIKTVNGNNDFLCMREVLSRRLERLDDEQFGARPDLLLIDGGKGQLRYSLAALLEGGVDIPIAALAEREEEVYIPNRNQPILLARDSYALRLLERTRDEAHRFAVTYSRSLRSTKYLSQLEQISGIGKERRLAIFEKFSSLDKIRSATAADLETVPGLGKKNAKAVYDFFHPATTEGKG